MIETPPGPGRAAFADELAALVAHAAHGSQSAFGALYEATAASSFGMASSILRDGPEAEAACLEAYLCLWRRAAQFDETRQSAFSWVAASVHRHAVLRVTSASVLGGPRRTGDRSDPFAAGGRHHAGARSSPLAERVRDAIAGLPPAQRETLTLTYFGCSIRSAAVLTGTTDTMARGRLHEALAAVRRQLVGPTSRWPLSGDDPRVSGSVTRAATGHRSRNGGPGGRHALLALWGRASGRRSIDSGDLAQECARPLAEVRTTDLLARRQCCVAT